MTQQQQPDPQLLALIAAYQLQTRAVRDQVTRFIDLLWRSLGSYRTPQVPIFTGQVIPVVLGAERHVASLTASYLATYRQLSIGGPGTPVAVSPARVTGPATRLGVDPTTVYERPFHKVWRDISNGVPPDTAIGRGLKNAQTSAVSDIQRAKVLTSRDVIADDAKPTWYERILEGSHSCGLCIVASTQRYRKAKLLPIHPGCVPGDAAVSSRNVVAVSRRWYAGELAVITTAAGDQIRVTPNHPVLTEEGWVPARLVREGDAVLRNRAGHGLVDGGPDEQHGPTLAEDVWRAASMALSLVKVPLAAEDFHGDGTHGEVDVVRTDRDLAPVGAVQFGEPLTERLLMDRGFGRVALSADGGLATLLPGTLATARGVVGSGSLEGALFGGHLSGSDEAGGATPARFDAPREEFSPESASVYSSRGRDLIGRLAGQVEADRVVKTAGVSFAGHVYNLHTAEGWYSADSHIVSNCDCGVAPRYGDPDDEPLNLPRLQNVHDAIQATFGESSAAAREIPDAYLDGKPVLYRDVLIEHEHGELGPVLAVRGHHFTGPDDLP